MQRIGMFSALAHALSMGSAVGAVRGLLVPRSVATHRLRIYGRPNPKYPKAHQGDRETARRRRQLAGRAQ